MLEYTTIRMLQVFAVGAVLISDTSAQTIATPVGDPTPVENVDDPVNQIALQNSITAVRVTLDIRGNDVAIKSARMIRVRGRDFSQSPKSDHISVNAVDDNDIVVGKASRADERQNILEGSGQVIREQRFVSIAVPLIRPAKEILVALPNESEPTRRLPLPDAIDGYCVDFPDDEICSREPVEDHPFFRDLNPDPP